MWHMASVLNTAVRFLTGGHGEGLGQVRASSGLLNVAREHILGSPYLDI